MRADRGTSRVDTAPVELFFSGRVVEWRGPAPCGTPFTTSLIPRDGGYLLPLKDAVRKPRRISAGDQVDVEVTVRLKT
jgi:hypothetical protein